MSKRVRVSSVFFSLLAPLRCQVAPLHARLVNLLFAWFHQFDEVSIKRENLVCQMHFNKLRTRFFPLDIESCA